MRESPGDDADRARLPSRAPTQGSDPSESRQRFPMRCRHLHERHRNQLVSGASSSRPLILNAIHTTCSRSTYCGSTPADRRKRPSWSYPSNTRTSAPRATTTEETSHVASSHPSEAPTAASGRHAQGAGRTNGPEHGHRLGLRRAPSLARRPDRTQRSYTLPMYLVYSSTWGMGTGLEAGFRATYRSNGPRRPQDNQLRKGNRRRSCRVSLAP